MITVGSYCVVSIAYERERERERERAILSFKKTLVIANIV